MLCSTIILTINRPSLERAINSVLTQGLAPEQHEIFVVNDSGEPLPEFDWVKSPQIKIVNTNRFERSKACNVGAAAATGKYIKILHDDDYLLPGALIELIDIAEKSNCAWVYGALNRIDDNDMIMSINRPEVKGNLFAHIVAGDCFHLGASLISREAFFAVGSFDNKFNTAEDRELQSRIALKYCFERTDMLVANIRIGETDKSTTMWDMKTWENRLIREKAFDFHGALFRILDSVQGDINLRGRCCRAYMISALLNFRAGRIFVTFSRLYNLMPLAGRNIMYRKFWDGLFTRSHWHRFEKEREERYLKNHFIGSTPDK